MWKIFRNDRSRKRSLKELKKNYQKDMQRYIKYSFEFTKEKTKRSYQSDLIFYYHKIEKGLSMPNSRVGFGKQNVEHLLRLLECYVRKFGWDNIALISLDTLYEYHRFNEINGYKFEKLLRRLKKLEKSLNGKERLFLGGMKTVTKQEIIENSEIDFKNFAYSRHSVRQFAPGRVSMAVIEEAIYIAQKTPSVCNRQTSKVYVYDDPIMKEKVLKYQKGHTGFGEKADKILIVTSELRDFRGVIERNQSYIDGGMYAMSLIYALHSLGLGTCALNLSITNETEEKLKKVGRISDSEALIMMIAVGHLPEKFNVPLSSRRKVSEVMTIY